MNEMVDNMKHLNKFKIHSKDIIWESNNEGGTDEESDRRQKKLSNQFVNASS